MSEDIADLPRLLNQPRRLSVSPLSIVRSFVRSGSLPNLASFHLFSFLVVHSFVVPRSFSITRLSSPPLPLFYRYSLPLYLAFFPLSHCVFVSLRVRECMLYISVLSLSLSLSPPSLPCVYDRCWNVNQARKKTG